MKLEAMTIDEMIDLHYNCTCGRTHIVNIKHIHLGLGAINALPEVLQGFLGKHIWLVADQNTYSAAGSRAELMLGKDFRLSRYVFEEEQLIPDECAVGKLLIGMPEDTAFILGVGSGTISDLCRYISYKTHIPYGILCTAPSMDGYASNVSPLLINGVKVTSQAVYPYAIIADTGIMNSAPITMLQAGLGDILGKYTALADWHLAEIINEEYFCHEIERLVLKAVDKCAEASLESIRRDPRAVGSMAEALILSGLTIGMAGNSRPASGEEHHLSHCWEAVFMNKGKQDKWLHGTKVGVGVGIIMEAYRYLKGLDIHRIEASGEYLMFNESRWVKTLQEVYGKSSIDIIAAKKAIINFDSQKRKTKMEKIVDNWDRILELCDKYLPEPDSVRGILKDVGAITSPAEMGIDRELFKQSFIAAKDIRMRYGILQLMEDIGVLEEAAEAIADIYYS
ncbi:MAG: glycerol dehydrogenase-like oxidoreductase [Clostridiales bacterium]|nr:glycerol dehydrogenase-like oxidoreductase [Clostridiales bacterium]